MDLGFIRRGIDLLMLARLNVHKWKSLTELEAAPGKTTIGAGPGATGIGTVANGSSPEKFAGGGRG